MSSKTISRASLKGLPEQQKMGQIDAIVNNTTGSIQSIAMSGKTSYMYELGINKVAQEEVDTTFNQPYRMTPITNDELIAGFKRKFPDCDISYQEAWIEVKPNNKVLKKGILIDWS